MVIASYNLSQSNRVPYVTATECLNSAIANNVDFGNLIENGDANQQAALAQQAAQNRSGLMQQQAGHDQAAAEQHVDLQGRLQQIQLTQSENMRMQRIRNGIADVEANPNLSPEEKRDLKMQMGGLRACRHAGACAKPALLAADMQALTCRMELPQHSMHSARTP